jgi:cysteinyl-tRNA synthetase
VRKVRIHDTLTREVRQLVPITPPKVGLFVCGLTPYAPSHLGHGKFAVTFDVIARALRRWGYRVFYVQNVTNLDDKLIARAGEAGTDPLALAERHFRAWLDAMARLRVASVNYYPFATDYVPEILDQIRALIERGHAYAAGGSVYYSVTSFPSYGRLSGQRVEALRPGARVPVEPEKRAPEDFVIWKASTPGEPSWESPWGPGRPGWHIEDTAITGRLLGAQYDLHGAATDLKFPHHEAEIALAEGASGLVPFVNFWLHTGLLTFGGEKMSKSLGNVTDLAATLDRWGPDVLRFFYLNAHYRSPLEFEDGKSLPGAQEAYATLSGPALRLAEAAGKAPGTTALPEEVAQASDELVERLDELMADDFRTREVLAELFGWSRTVNGWLPKLGELDEAGREALAAPYRWAQEVLGLLEPPTSERSAELAVGPALAARTRARARGDFAEADRIREELKAAGIVVEDGADGPRWRPTGPGDP